MYFCKPIMVFTPLVPYQEVLDYKFTQNYSRDASDPNMGTKQNSCEYFVTIYAPTMTWEIARFIPHLVQ